MERQANRVLIGASSIRQMLLTFCPRFLVRPFLEDSHKHGCTSWDVMIAKCLPAVLIASLGARSGDVARSDMYTGSEYMRWHHIELSSEGCPGFRNLCTHLGRIMGLCPRRKTGPIIQSSLANSGPRTASTMEYIYVSLSLTAWPSPSSPS